MPSPLLAASQVAALAAMVSPGAPAAWSPPQRPAWSLSFTPGAVTSLYGDTSNDERCASEDAGGACVVTHHDDTSRAAYHAFKQRGQERLASIIEMNPRDTTPRWDTTTPQWIYPSMPPISPIPRDDMPRITLPDGTGLEPRMAPMPMIGRQPPLGDAWPHTPLPAPDGAPGRDPWGMPLLGWATR